MVSSLLLTTCPQDLFVKPSFPILFNSFPSLILSCYFLSLKMFVTLKVFELEVGIDQSGLVFF